MRCIVLTHRSI
jgi:hypothetical protein